MGCVRSKLILGSRSPRRLELLRQIVPVERVAVLPPRSIEEPGFMGADDWETISQRLLEIARGKRDDVLEQLARQEASLSKSAAAVIAADTVIVGTTSRGAAVALGQPPQTDIWQRVVRQWFVDYYLGKTHVAATALCVATPDGRRTERIVRTNVTFRADSKKWLDWYLDTGEPLGKAGGYALQGAGSVFVERVEGSLSNIVGLPLEALIECLEELGIHVTSAISH